MNVRSSSSGRPDRSTTARPRGSRRGGAGTVLAGAVALGAVTLASFSLMSSPGDSSGSASSTSEYRPMPANRWAAAAVARKYKMEIDRQLVRALSLVGITPESLAAAGVASESVAGVVSNAQGYLAENGTALWASIATHRTAVADKATKQRKVVAGIATENEKTAAATACSTLSSACSARDSAVNALYAAATASLNNDQKAVLAALRTNKGREFDLKYLTVTRTEDQWTALRDALANARIAAKTGEEADGTAATLISTTNGESAVSAAASGMTNTLPAVTTAWDQAVSG